MKKVITHLFVIITIAGFLTSCGKEDAKVLTLLQNKPEIDSQLKIYGAKWAESSGFDINIKSVGGTTSATLQQQLKADYAAGDMPDIFIIEGIEAYKDWEGIILDLGNEPWVDKTSVAFKVDGKVYGFPVAIEGWGIAYNRELLEKAGIDPATLNNYNSYKKAFLKLDNMKTELGIESVISMAASSEMSWVTAHHNFNSLLSNGLPYGDMSVVDDLNAGIVDAARLKEYADWVELLFKYADKQVLTTGNYESQVGAFARGKSVFIHQGNWIDPNMKSANVQFEMAFAPHGSMNNTTDGIFVAAPSFYVINKTSENIEAAKKFLNDLVFTDAGQDYMVNKVGMIPAYSNIQLKPKGQLSISVQEWASKGKVYSWNQYNFSNSFRDQTLGPIYNRFANEEIDKKEFIKLLTEAFEDLK